MPIGDPATTMTEETWTIQRLLAWTRDWLTRAGSPSPRIDAELLLGEVLHVGRLELLLRFDQPVQKDELTAFKALIKRRARGEPVAYILGRREFYGLDLQVSPAVLVPRPETESLVDAVVAFLRSAEAPAGPVLDLCTGSGAIALAVADTLAKAGQPRPVVATDVSLDALAVAQSNAQRVGLPDAIDWRPGDLWAALRSGEVFAAIVSNPPYVLSGVLATLERDVRDFEPHLALDGGPDGMRLLADIARRAGEFLAPGGLLAVELGSRAQGQRMVEAGEVAGLGRGKVEPVMGGPTCVVTLRSAG